MNRATLVSLALAALCSAAPLSAALHPGRQGPAPAMSGRAPASW